mmetsp:Transcript_19901/g.46979  ORF Transcript_19901/g.46979 Transcript_19901/m.46979 type:complete len:330 (-) Transcript_19901:96-1085(-)
MSWFSVPFCGYSCEFSPFRGNLLAIGTGQYFGIVGNGKLHVLDIAAPGGQPVCEWMTNQAVYDVAWSEANEHVLLTGQADGTLKLFDWTNPQGPIMSLEEHTAEVYGVDWNLNEKHLISSAAWDHSVKVWDAMRGVSVSTFRAHQNLAYAAIWSPARPACLASVGGDAMLHIQDLNAGEMPVQSIQAHQHEILTVDWNKYNEFMVVTGSVDKTIRTFDLRNFGQPLQILHGHQLAVKRVKCHPYNETQIVSCSYDTAVNVFDMTMGQMIQHFDQHTEFTLGVDLSLFEENVIASTSWDCTACVWNLTQPPPPPPPAIVKRVPRQPPGVQ